MPDWRREAGDFAAAIERHLRLAANRVERVIDRSPYAATGYRGYGSRE
jgi:hypothetical protein